MNCSTYFFAKTNSTTAYYPSDNSNCEVFDKFIRESQEGWQLCIARNGNLMYYAVVKKESAKCYYGLCVLVNNIIFTDIKSVYQIIVAYLNQIANDGELIVWYSGILIELDFTIQKNVNYVENVLERLRLGIENVHDYAQLPAQDYSRDVDSIVHMKDIDDNDELLKSTYSNGFTFIHISRTEGTKIAETNNREKENSKLKGEKADLERQNEELRSEIRSLKIANIKLQLLNRNYVPIVLLGVAIIGLLIMGYNWYVETTSKSDLESKIAILETENNTLMDSSDSSKADLENKISLLEKKIQNQATISGRYIAADFTYYGPLKNGLPNGIGLAVYHNGDKDNRKYYVGGFKDGIRDDPNKATLIYNDGSILSGKWKDGIITSGYEYNKQQRFIYEGPFKHGAPSGGSYYKVK